MAKVIPPFLCGFFKKHSFRSAFSALHSPPPNDGGGRYFGCGVSGLKGLYTKRIQSIYHKKLHFQEKRTFRQYKYNHLIFI